MKFLIVDDSKAIRFLLKRFLEALGHEVTGEASNGNDALTLFRKLAPDVVTLDIVMPGLDGMGVLKALQTEPHRAKILVVTSAASISNLMQTKELGATNFLIKPFRKEDVARALTNFELKRAA